MKNKTKRFPAIVGPSSLIVIFAVLCLSVFSILTLSTAKAQERLSTVSAESIKNYYKADSEAELILSKIRNGEVPPQVTVTDNVYSYTCQITDTLLLEVEVMLENGKWTVIRWESVSINS